MEAQLCSLRASATRLTGKHWAAPTVFFPRLPPPTCSRPVSDVGLGLSVMRGFYRGLPAPALLLFFALRSLSLLFRFSRSPSSRIFLSLFTRAHPARALLHAANAPPAPLSAPSLGRGRRIPLERRKALCVRESGLGLRVRGLHQQRHLKELDRRLARARLRRRRLPLPRGLPAPAPLLFFALRSVTVVSKRMFLSAARFLFAAWVLDKATGDGSGARVHFTPCGLLGVRSPAAWTKHFFSGFPLLSATTLA